MIVGDRTPLAGGFINSIFLQDGIVHKTFNETPHSFASAQTRLNRERLALSFFSRKGIAPAFLGIANNNELLMEFVEGETFDKKADRGEMEVLNTTGRLLREIHTPVNSNPHIIKETFDHYTDHVLRLAKNNSLFTEFDFKQVHFPIDWEIVYKQGTTRIHGDYWLGNIKEMPDGKTKVLDWEYSRVGTPYQDFVSLYLFTILKYGHAADIWKGYGSEPDAETLKQFVRQQCFRYMATCAPETYATEGSDGFYHTMWNIFTELS